MARAEMTLTIDTAAVVKQLAEKFEQFELKYYNTDDGVWAVCRLCHWETNGGQAFELDSIADAVRLTIGHVCDVDAARKVEEQRQRRIARLVELGVRRDKAVQW